MSFLRTLLIPIGLLLATLLCAGSIQAAPPDGFARIHFHRMAGDYDGWGLHVWGDGLKFDRKVTWNRPLAASGSDGFGIYFDIPISEVTQRVGFIIHKGAQKNVPEDMGFNVVNTKEIWSIEGDSTLYTSRGAAAATLVPTQKKAELRAAIDRTNEKKEAALKAEMLAIAKKTDEEAKKKELELKQKEEEDKARLAAERDRKLAELKKKADYKLANGEQERYAQQKREMEEELARNAEAYRKSQERKIHGERMSPGEQFALYVGGGFATLMVIVLIFFLWQRRKAVSNS